MRTRRASIAGLLSGVTLLAAGVRADPQDADTTPAYKNLKLSFAERAADLVGRMDLKTKADQVQMATQAVNNPETGVVIPACNWWTEGLHGLSRGLRATTFPQAIGMAAMWDPAMMRKIGDATADEARVNFDPYGARYRGIIVWAPTINMARDPRWGRNQETYGEDPILTSRLAVEFVKGLQGDDPKYLKTVATPKHFAVHSQETGRHELAFDVSERTMREYYLPAFHACFTEGKAMSTMVSYNGINGVPNTANHWLLTDLLRTEWGFEGAVVTDWGAVPLIRNFNVPGVTPGAPRNNGNGDDECVAAAINAGVDVMCDQRNYTQNVLSAVSKGLLSEKTLNQAVLRNLTLRFRLGMFDPPEVVPFPRSAPTLSKTMVDEHLALARKAAQESMVLMQNNTLPQGYGMEKLLPLDLRKVRSIAMLGPYADVSQYGNYAGPTARPTVPSPIQAMRAAAGERVKVSTADFNDYDACATVAKSSDVAIVFLGLTSDRERGGSRETSVLMEQEGSDKPTLDLPIPQMRLLRKVLEVNPMTIVVMEGGSQMTLTEIKEKVPALLMAWYPGEQGSEAIADVLLGNVNPAGRSPITFYEWNSNPTTHLLDFLPLNDYEISHGRTYMYCEKPVSYTFGHGLSYTTFGYSNLKIDRKPGGDTATVTLDVANTGKRDGDEVVQLYTHKANSVVSRPIKQLMGFSRVMIAAGQTKSVTIEVRIADLAYWDTPTHRFIVESGPYEVMAGASSSDIRLRGTLDIAK